MSYPNAYCVKCSKNTETIGKKTIVMRSGARAVKGTCKDCESEVFKIIPKDKDAEAKAKAQGAKGVYPDAYCLKCQDHTPTRGARTVLLENNSRAVKGACGICGSPVYRIMPKGKGPKLKVGSTIAKDAGEAAPAASQRPDDQIQGKSTAANAALHNASGQALIQAAPLVPRGEAGAMPMPRPALVDQRRQLPRLSQRKVLAVALVLIGGIVCGFLAMAAMLS